MVLGDLPSQLLDESPSHVEHAVSLGCTLLAAVIGKCQLADSLKSYDEHFKHCIRLTSPC